jgi:vacuolar-type H+-ATPase subunit E/Vma4
MELGQGSYRQLADEIGEVLQAAAETAEKMQEEARVQAARIRAEAEAELRTAYADGRRILEEARMEADMLRAEAEWQSQEILAQARRQAAERMAGANTRLADLDDDSADQPTAKVYFVEFPPLAPTAPEPAAVESSPDPEADIVLTESPGASLFNSERQRSEWAPPAEMPTWWTRDGAQG